MAVLRLQVLSGRDLQSVAAVLAEARMAGVNGVGELETIVKQELELRFGAVKPVRQGSPYQIKVIGAACPSCGRGRVVVLSSGGVSYQLCVQPWKARCRAKYEAGCGWSRMI